MKKRVKVKNIKNVKSVTLKEGKEYKKRKDIVTSFFLSKNYVPLKINEIASFLGVKKNEKNILKEIINNLIDEGIIYKNDSGKYSIVNKKDIIHATYDYQGESYGFAICDDKNEEDIYIPKKYSKNAFNQDKILVLILKNIHSGKRRVGRVLKIEKRAIETVIGEVYIAGLNTFVQPIDSKIPSIMIKDLKKNACYKSSDIVKVRITDYEINGNMSGVIEKVISNSKEYDAYVKALFDSYDLQEKVEFPKNVIDEVDTISDSVQKYDLKNRVNKTKDNVYTIDSEDSKDLDDAISVIKKDEGGFKLSVHIADVSHYVIAGTKTDIEALKRGTSIYIPGMVLPMLPKKLSNGICSLNEGKIRLTLSIDMDISKDGEVISHKIYKSYIKSKKKMTYEKVHACIIKSDEKVLEEYKEYLEDINNMLELSKLLKTKRNKEGSINFDIPETKVVLNKKGKLVDICEYKKNESNDIIEEFMLLANKTVAEEFYFLKAPFIYRIHEKPDEDKLKDLNRVLVNYNKKIKTIKNITSKSLADILKDFESEEEKEVISTLTLRTLKLARYDEKCLGHFGLAFKYYCHFTSPIRRYPDLFIHRVISDYLESGYKIGNKKYNEYLKQASSYSNSSSENEKEATKIERDFDDLYAAMYMQDKVGFEFEGLISSITSFGLFVKLKNTVEGLVHISNLKGYYIYDDKRYMLISKNGKCYKIGDKLKVKVIKVDVRLKQVDFAVVMEGENGK